MAELKTVSYNGLKVFYKAELDGGGRAFGQDYIPEVARRFGKVDRIYEFCSGPGFIGFSLLAHGLCNSLCLSDINPEAIECVRRTIKENALEDKVSAYVSDGLSGIPSSEKWDLVVSNPPHFDGTEKQAKENILMYDRNWKIHREFYKNIGKFLRNGGIVFLQENESGGNASVFKEMIETAGLAYVEDYKPKKRYLNRSRIIKAIKKACQQFPRVAKMASAFFGCLQYNYYFIYCKK